MCLHVAYLEDLADKDEGTAVTVAAFDEWTADIVTEGVFEVGLREPFPLNSLSTSSSAPSRRSSRSSIPSKSHTNAKSRRSERGVEDYQTRIILTLINFSNRFKYILFIRYLFIYSFFFFGKKKEGRRRREETLLYNI